MKKLLLIFYFLFLSIHLFAVELVNEQFTSNINGWSVSNNSKVYWSSAYGGSMFIDRRDRAWKTYAFGSAYANQTLTVEVRWCATYQWESNNDYLRVKVNSSTVEKDYDGGGCQNTTFTADADSSGDFEIEFSPRTSANNEDAYIEWFTVNGNPSITTTEWVANGAFSSATISPSPYTDNADDTETLTVAGATNLEVTILGTLENANNGSCTWDYVTITDAGGTIYPRYCGNINDTFIVAGDYINLLFHSDQSVVASGVTVSITSIIPNSPPVFTSTAPASVNDNVSYSYVPTTADPEGDTVTLTATTLPSWLNFNGTTLSGVPGVANIGDHIVTLSADDGNGGVTIQTFTISVILVSNLPPIFTSIPITAGQINIPYSYLVTTSDPNGDTVTVTGTTLPGWLSFNGTQLTGTPTLVGTYNVTLTADDGNGGTDVQSFAIEVTNDTNYTSGFVDFHIVNPPSTRNINGSFAVAGNTVTCLTANTSGYGGDCHGQNDYQFETSNNRVNKFIDIDGDNSTWNSTSSNITLPVNTYQQNNGNGILWAGLFWQGRFSTDTGYVMRYGMENGASYNLIEMGKNAPTYNAGDTINIENLDANKIKLKVDTGNYQNIQANELFTYTSSNGATYAAYADVTYALRNANLAPGEHTFTVANLTTNEGRESSPGLFGGWSLVVIYAENADGDLRNVTVYHGLQLLGDTPTIKISGFKLPLKGPVSSQATVFSGEGEHLYGKTTNSSSYDWMKISNLQNSGYVYLPGPTEGTHVGNRDNMFNGQLANIDRDNIADNNLQINNNGVDIDLFNVSSIMESYRNANINTNEIYLRGDSNNDYVTPSMIAFSTELYKPNVCYDIALHRNGFVIPASPQEINTTANVSDEISVTIAIKSLESDFDLTNSALAVLLNQFKGHIDIDNTKAPKYSPTNSNALFATIYTTNSTSNRPEIAIGKNRNASIGGTLGAYEQYFVKYYYIVNDTNNSEILSQINVELNTSIDFGSGPIAQILPLERCEQSPTYNPQWNQFNVERHTSTNPIINNATDRYSLYTQIAGQDFDYSVVNYGPTGSYTTETVVTGLTVDVELLNADAFDDNTSALKCSNPDPSIIYGGFGNSRFVTFNNQSRVPIIDPNDMINTDAIRNAVFRIWVLSDANNSIVPHTSPRTDGATFKTIYDDNYKVLDIEGTCTTACDATNGVVGNSSCYNCLRLNFASAICSRDNFSIRPASYRLSISDAGPDANETSTSTLVQNSFLATPDNSENLVAEYPYLLNGYATDSSGNLVNGYTKNRFEFNSNTYQNNASILTDNTVDIALMQFQDDITNCNDTQHYSYNIVFDGGSLIKYNLTGRNTGSYDFFIKDNTWTKVDQAVNNPYKTLFDPTCFQNSDPACNDCIVGSGIIGENNNKSGCTTLSDLPLESNYEDLSLTFNPYRFDMSGLVFERRPTASANTDTLYFNNLNDSLLMSIGYDGRIVAKGFSNTDLSNFVAGCTAQDIIFETNTTTIPNNITDEDGNLIDFQQVLVDSTGIASAIVLNENNLTLDSTNFSKVQNGGTNITIHYNYAKPLASPINPADVNISLLIASSPNASASANMSINFIPDGNITGGTKRFYYARTVPGQTVYKTKEDFVLTQLLTQVYCFDVANVLCQTMGLNTIAYPAVVNNLMWYSADVHDPLDGGILDIQVVSGAGNLTPNGALDFTTGRRNDLNVGYSGNGRPEINDINATFSPWLNYISNTVSYRVIFTSQGNWTGIGKTGNVIDTLPKDEPNNRISW